MTNAAFDVIVVGAGLSGIDAGYHLQTSLPHLSYTILEGRERLGGTWDLFRYPGIRSDSDMLTLGFPFHPWTNPKAIADGDAILAYLEETARHYGIDKKIQYRAWVTAARWSSADARWTIALADGRELTARFLYVCSGYYDYDGGYTPDLPGMAAFKGRIVHPQKWSADVEYAGKRVIVIGSGATAVTLVPALATGGAAHVTMLQRSPTYIMSRPAQDPIVDWLAKRLPPRRAASIGRWKNVLMGQAFFSFSRRFPARAKQLLVGGVAARIKDKAAVAEHFTPSYKVWDQRLCLVPDADLFRALKSRTAEVVTGHIDTITETGIRLKDGRELAADLIVTATGLVLKLFGGMTVTLDGKAFDPAASLTYKGMMLSDVPNFAFAAGYTNASWTLKCDLTSRFVCRLLGEMERREVTTATPRRPTGPMEELPLIDFSSGYVSRSIERFPKQGAVAPWRLYQNYVLDLLALKYGRVRDRALEFGPSAKGRPGRAADGEPR